MCHDDVLRVGVSGVDRGLETTSLFRQRRKPLHGFMLIELLVVISIISLLIALLLPALGKAREAAMRTKCAAQLRAVSSAASIHAGAYRGYLARAGGANVSGHQLRPTIMLRNFPRMIEQAGAPTTMLGEFENCRYGNGARHPVWRGHGTSFETWRSYGINLAMLNCPSTEYVPTEGNDNDYTPHWQAGIGQRVLMDYIIMSGIQRPSNAALTPQNTPGASYTSESKWVGNDGIADPAYSLEDTSLSDRIVAADRVEWHPDIFGMYSNHDSLDPSVSGNQPTFQNVAYGDGHVRAIGRDVYVQPIHETNWSHNAPGGDPEGGRYKRMYWGQ